MERLTAFEFIPVSNRPQLVRLKRGETELLSAEVVGWLALSFGARVAHTFHDRQELTIEGQGIGRPYWNDEQPAWVQGFTEEAELERIAVLKTAMERQLTVDQ